MMRTRMSASIVATAAVVALLSATSAPVAAQWAPRPAAGVAKKPGNLPDAQAPAPKTADGKPTCPASGKPEKNRPCPPEGCTGPPHWRTVFRYRVGPQGRASLSAVGGGACEDPHGAKRQQRIRGPAASPPGSWRSHTFPLLKKIVRAAWTHHHSPANGTPPSVKSSPDSRPLPVDVDLPSFNGFSSAKWQGDTLVVETTGFNDDLLARSTRQPVDERGQDHRTLLAARVTASSKSRSRVHDQEGLHGAVDREVEPAHRAGHRAAGLCLPGKRKVS